MLNEPSKSDTGMDLRDLLTDATFLERPKHHRDPGRSAIALRRLLHAFAEDGPYVLQEIVDAAVVHCGADSAGISLEEPESGTFRWVVIAGSFAPYLNGRTPRNYSPCGTCLDSGRPQLYRLAEPYYEYLGVRAEPITDGILIPWTNELMKGTLWAVSHSSPVAFDVADYEFLKSLTDCASIILRHKSREQKLRETAEALAAAGMAHKLAHRINNPLQSLTNTLFLARHDEANAKAYLYQAEVELRQLSEQVALLLHSKKRE
jgi:hypothetical protein